MPIDVPIGEHPDDPNAPVRSFTFNAHTLAEGCTDAQWQYFVLDVLDETGATTTDIAIFPGISADL